MMVRRAVPLLPAAGLAAIVLAGCSSGTHTRDDRPRVRSAISSLGAQLVVLHDIASTPAAYLGDCRDGWAPVSFSAPLINPTTDPLEQEQNVLGAAALSGVRLDRVRELTPPAPGEPAYVFATKDGHTQLTVTVPVDKAVRIDGYASCPGG